MGRLVYFHFIDPVYSDVGGLCAGRHLYVKDGRMGDDFRWVKEPLHKPLEEMTWWEIAHGAFLLFCCVGVVVSFGSCYFYMWKVCNDDVEPEKERMVVYQAAEQHLYSGDKIEAYAIASHLRDTMNSSCVSDARNSANALMMQLEEIMTKEELREAKGKALMKEVADNLNREDDRWRR